MSDDGKRPFESGREGGGRRSREQVPLDTLMGREPPFNLEAEARILSCCFIDKGDRTLQLCQEAKLTPDAFYSPAHQILYQRIRELHSEKGYVDEVLVTDRLEEKRELERVGGAVAIAKLGGMVASVAGATYWVDIVRRKWILRRLIRTSTNVIQQAYSDPERIDEFLGQVESEFLEINQERVGDTAVPAERAIEAAVKLVNLFSSRSGQLSGLATGFSDLDKMTNGLQPKDMVVLAARPSMGKTSFAMNIVENVICPKDGRKPTPTLVFSLEMSADQLAFRLLCARAEVSMTKVREGFLGRDSPDNRRVSAAATELKAAPLWLDESSGISILELRAKARRVHHRYGLGLIVIDYLQLLTGTDKTASRENQVAEISRGVKAMAKEIGVPVLVLSQLNREAEKENRQPRLSDLRESGAIEQDADVVFILSSKIRKKEPGDKDREPEPELAQAMPERELIIAKQRNGPVGTVSLVFDRNLTKFRDAVHEA